MNEKCPTRISGFEILEKIGEGGMGAVFRGRQTSLERDVAIKILAPFLSSNDEFKQRFIKEAKSAARLSHPNIVSVIDAGNVDGTYYCVMEYVDGETLHHWVKRKACLPQGIVVDIGLCVANALKYAWDRERLLHRDIKPDNVIVDYNGNVKVCDLGLAKSFGEATTFSLNGFTMGTPQYMSPEQARAELSQDCRGDIYSLGMTMYYAVTGSIPFHGGTPAIIMARQLTEQLPDPRSLKPDISFVFCRVLQKMLAKDACDRYPTWDDAIIDLELIASGKQPKCELITEGRSSLRLNTITPRAVGFAGHPSIKVEGQRATAKGAFNPVSKAGKPSRKAESGGRQLLSKRGDHTSAGARGSINKRSQQTAEEWYRSGRKWMFLMASLITVSLLALFHLSNLHAPKDEEVMKRIQFLGRFPDRYSLDQLVAYVRHDNDKFALAAARELLKRLDDPYAESLVEQLARDPDERVRARIQVARDGEYDPRQEIGIFPR